MEFTAASNTTGASSRPDLQDPEGKQKPLEIKTIFWVYMNDCPKTAPSKK